ncbi:MAG TPA: HipA domain-containing protein [Treponemataceae bacterium]|jgi:serine/threonine-protein kinase HipA|nr:HipA domain-containing protein [Treponemataceae bacterium]
MKPTDNKLCLCCGKSLEGSSFHDGWHTSCSLRFFGLKTVPHLDISAENLESHAQIFINSGTAVTGVQKKMSLHLESNENDKRLTLVGYPAGFILKPPAAEYPDLPELEHALMSLADTAGIKTVPHALIRMASNETAYITRRIDRRFPFTRTGSAKIPMEDFCQLSQRLTEDKYKGSYEQCGKIIAQYSSRPGLDMADFFFLLLFCFVTGNADMHLKNFSLIQTDSGYILSPSYDLVPTHMLIPNDTEESALTVNGKKNRITASDFTALGANLNLQSKVIDNMIKKTVSVQEIFFKTPALNLLSQKRQEELQALVKERCARLGKGI